MEEYEAAALRGQASLAAALLSRYNQRMSKAGIRDPDVLGRVRSIVGQLFLLNNSLRKLGADPERPPVFVGTTWIDQLAWGVDSMIACVRLLVCGQVIGAAQIARSQIERWAMNLEHNAGTARSQGESTSDYYDRLWACLDENGMLRLSLNPEQRGNFRFVLVGERWVRPGYLYGQLSELLHGRGDSIAAVRAETIDLLKSGLDHAHTLKPQRQILDIVELCVERIATCTASAFSEAGRRENAAVLHGAVRDPKPAGIDPFPELALVPLLPGAGFLPNCVRFLEPGTVFLEKVYRGEHPAGRSYYDHEISELFFVARRASSAKFAASTYEFEARLMAKPVEDVRLPRC